ncbi:34435_t:CDS:2 [Gigaspora margarita]|uniref:34435_t:CDS:1 n=1 Tax=Gigaspora margarita TaxID=4874 RepID=A0ABN7UHK9_GIGMA|nr:34435_t:CDS:2 [Gigaspora margarita]
MSIDITAFLIMLILKANSSTGLVEEKNCKIFSEPAAASLSIAACSDAEFAPNSGGGIAPGDVGAGASVNLRRTS